MLWSLTCILLKLALAPKKGFKEKQAKKSGIENNDASAPQFWHRDTMEIVKRASVEFLFGWKKNNFSS